jgi:hypothetical protein
MYATMRGRLNHLHIWRSRGRDMKKSFRSPRLATLFLRGIYHESYGREPSHSLALQSWYDVGVNGHDWLGRKWKRQPTISIHNLTSSTSPSLSRVNERKIRKQFTHSEDWMTKYYAVLPPKRGSFCM